MSGIAMASHWSPARVGIGLVVLAVIQVGLVNHLPTAWAVPDLVVVAVLALGIVGGPVTGALVGAWAGLVLDLIPPAAGPMGGWMLVLALVGAAIGRVGETYQPGPSAAMALLALGAGAVVLGRAAVLWFAGVSPSVLPTAGSALAAAGWALVLAPLALLLVTRADRSGARPRPVSLTPLDPRGLGTGVDPR